MDFPNDADGDSLRNLVDTGSDLSKPMEIDFAVAVPDQRAGEAFAKHARLQGYQTEVSRDEAEGEELDTWTCYCTRTMLAVYDDLVEAQRQLDELAQPFGGHIDGWGTWGNKNPPASRGG